MHVTHAQMTTMGAARFTTQVWQAIRQTLNYTEPAPEDFGAFCHRCQAAARGYRLRDELSHARFIFTAWVLGEDFHLRIPTIQLVLEASDLSSLQKSAALINFMRVFFGELLKDRE